MKWLLYGATGYSGELIARYAKQSNLSPILAGRSKEKLEMLAKELNLPYRTFSLEDKQVIEENIADCNFIFNAAGPFTETNFPLLEVCLEKKIHNLSLVGEIPMLEALYKRNNNFINNKILCAIGLGFDVYPTDCLIHLCKEKLPDATSLELTMDGPTSMSPGSYKELIQQVGEEPFWIRREGKLLVSKPKTFIRKIQNRLRLFSSIAWGDTASAFHSAGIENIDVFSTISISDWLSLKLLRLFRLFLKLKLIRNFAYAIVDRFVSGPDEKEREEGSVFLELKMKNTTGKEVRASLEVPTSYKITYLTAIYAIKEIMKRNELPFGYQTPAQWLGSKSIFEIPGVKWVEEPNVVNF